MTLTRLLRVCPFDGTDLRSSELASANAATPARRCGVWDYWHSLQIGAPSSYEFATAVWTLSLNHWFLQGKRPLAIED